MKITLSQLPVQLLVLSFLLFVLSPVASATGTSGWFAPLVDVIEETTMCTPGEAAVSIQLSDYYNNSPITGYVERWRVQIRGGDGLVVRGQNISGNTISNPLCFNPLTDGIQVAVHDSEASEYSPIITPTMYPDSALTNLPGFHFRGYVHLLNDVAPALLDIEQLSPVNTAVSSTPEIFVQTNYLPTVYGATALSQIRLYLLNQNTDDRYSLSIPASGGLGTRGLTGLPPDLAEGTYLWVYHQNFNGTRYTELPSTVYNWTFDNMPTTGVTPIQSFVIDRTPPGPITSVLDIALRGVPGVKPGLSFLMSFNVQSQDTQSGLYMTTLYITDEADVIQAVVPVEHSVAPASTVRPRDLQLTNFQIFLPRETTFKAYIVATDDAGNQTTSPVKTFTVPSLDGLTIPQITATAAYDIETTRAKLPAQLNNTGGAMILERGSCWTLTPSVSAIDVTDGVCIFEEAPVNGYASDIFFNQHSSLPADSEIFYITFATNIMGAGHSDVYTFNTLPSAFAPEALPVPPVITNLTPNQVMSDGANLGASINAIGGDNISSRTICWSLSPATLPSIPTRTPIACPMDLFVCGDGTSVTRTGPTCDFDCPAAPSFNVPIFCSFESKICPDGTEAERDSSCNFYCPHPQLTFNVCPMDAMICPDGTIVERTGSTCEFVCPTTFPSPTCVVWPGPLPADATLPFRFSNTFIGMPSNSTIHYRVFAENSFGESFADGSFNTEELWYDLSTTGSFEVAPVFNDIAETFTITVPVVAYDQSNHKTGAKKIINYRIERLNSDNVVQETRTGTIAAGYDPEFLSVVNDDFVNVPPGISIFRLTLNTNPTLYPEATTPLDRTLNNVTSRLINLVNPYEIFDFVTGTGSGVGPTLPNPGIILSFTQQVIRTGNAVDLSWNINETYPMNCRVTGPSTFGTNGIFEFDPSVDGPIASMSTGILTSAQLFELRCVEPITNSVFSTTTRINVVGRVNEI